MQRSSHALRVTAASRSLTVDVLHVVAEDKGQIKKCFEMLVPRALGGNPARLGPLYTSYKQPCKHNGAGTVRWGRY